MDKYKSEWDNTENTAYITHDGTAISNEGAVAILNINDTKIKALESKLQKREELLRDCYAAFTFINDTSPPLYRYNEVELRIISRARDFLNKDLIKELMEEK